jgi:hypothetical protein
MLAELKYAGKFNLFAFSDEDERSEEEDWSGEDDEDFEDELEDKNDLNEIRTSDDMGEPKPEDEDHLPDDDLQ